MIELAEAPSADLWRTLTNLTPAAMGEDDLVAAIVACERMKSAVEAYQNDLLVAWDRLDLPEVELYVYGKRARWRTEGLALELGVSAFSARHRVGQAVILVETLPHLHEALRCGQVTTHHARVTANAARHLPLAVALEADKAVMADGDGWRTPSQLERAFQAHVLRLDPQGAADRHDAARQDRQVSVRDQPDGMASAYALMPADDAQAFIKTLDACALSSKAQNTPGDDRTLAQRRADALVELVTGSSNWSSNFRPTAGENPPDTAETASTATASTDTASADTASSTADGARASAGPCTCGGTTAASTGTAASTASTASTVHRDAKTHGRRIDVQVTVGMSTLIGRDDAPAMLTGYGWIDATTARRICADPTAVWRRLLVDPASGALLDYVRTVYRPPADLRDFVLARDITCRFPNCDRPAMTSELDHRQEFDHTANPTTDPTDETGDSTTGGTTSPDNLDVLCKNHHRLKHETGWTHERDPDTDDSIWTDPHGNVYLKPASRHPVPATVTRAPAQPPAPSTPTRPGDLELGDPPF